MDGITIATITLARNTAEERAIIDALSRLKSYSLVSADGGSRLRFIASLHKLGAQILCPKEKGLVAQVKATLRGALDASDTPHILYTEPDKLPFFESALPSFIKRAAIQPKTAMLFASRNARAFATFPKGQRRSEEFMNQATSIVLGKNGKADYCYGPILLSRAAATLALDAPDHLGWGWRFWLLGRAAQKKLKFATVQLPVPCPKEQRNENTRKDQIYRLRQLRQNLEGLFLGLE